MGDGHPPVAARLRHSGGYALIPELAECVKVTVYLSRTRALCLAIFLRLSRHAVIFIKDWRGLLVFLKHRGMLDGRLGLVLPIFVFGFGLLLSDGGDVFAKQPRTQGADRWVQGMFIDPTGKKALRTSLSSCRS